MSSKQTRPDCSRVESFLDNCWADRPHSSIAGNHDPLLNAPGLPPGIGEHLSSCPRCRGIAEEIRRVDVSLQNSFETLGGFMGPPCMGSIEATIVRLREAGPDVTLIRKVRRPLRMLLWGSFYAFSLIACCALAITAYKAFVAAR